MMNFPTEIKPIIEELMTSPKFKKRWTEHIIQSKWEDWVGKKIAQHIWPKCLEKNQLIVIIDDDRWTNAFDTFKDKILEKIERDLGSLPIEGFAVMVEKKRLGKKKQKRNTKKMAQNMNPSKIQSSKPNQLLDKEMEMELNCIKDLAVREALKRLIIKSLSFKQK